MKFLLLLLLATSTALGATAVSPETNLAALQVEESGLKFRFSDANPLLQQTRAQIARLEAVPHIKNATYFQALQASLTQLKSERGSLKSKYADSHSRILTLDAQIRFIESALESKKG